MLTFVFPVAEILCFYFAKTTVVGADLLHDLSLSGLLQDLALSLKHPNWDLGEENV